MAAKRTCPSAGSSRRPRYQSRYMLKAMWRKPACRKPLVISRQYSWLIEIDGPNRAPFSTNAPPAWPKPSPAPPAISPTKATTQMAISA
jgi:hypothetical protein